MVLGIRCDSHPHTTEVSSGITTDQRVSNPSHHSCQSDQSLRVLTVGQETVALEDGSLYIASGTGQGNLKTEPPIKQLRMYVCHALSRKYDVKPFLNFLRSGLLHMVGMRL